MRLFDNKVIFVNTTYQCNVVCAKCMTRRSSKCGTSMSAGTRRILTEQLRTHDFKGCISMGTAEPLLDEARKIASNALEDCFDEGVREWTTIKNRVRDDLSKFIYERTKRSPMILPIIMEV